MRFLSGVLARALPALWLAFAGAPAASGAQQLAVLHPPPHTDAGVHRLRSEVSIHVDGASRAARIEILEEFRNRSGAVLEGDYLYPVPPGAVFENLSLFIGETEVRGEMLPAEQARAVYEDIVRRRKDPALVELLGHGLIRARVFPIEPGDTRKVILRFTQLLPRDGSVLRLRYPRAASRIVPAGERIEPRHVEPVHGFEPRPAAAAFSLRVHVEGAERFGTPVSPTSAIDVTRPSASVMDVVARSGADAGDDFELLLPLVREEVGVSLLAHSPDPGAENGYFMMLISPPAGDTAVRIARDVTLVLDVSGSMAGHKIEQARGALEQMLNSLTSVDRFRLITFSSAVRSWESDYRAASAANVEAAVRWLRATPADGSTNLADALRVALEPAAADRLSLLVLLSDGMPTVAETDPERIAAAAAALRDGERVFAFGVGADVNTYLLDRLAESGRGSVSYVRPDENVEAAVSSLARRIGAPVLANLRIVSAPATLEDTVPSVLPDLFLGDDLVLLGRYRGEGGGDLVLEGERGGERQRFTFHVRLPHRESGNAFVSRLWAARKAGALTAQVRLHGASAELVEEIRQLALRYGVLTEYTSYLVLEPGAMNQPREELEARFAAMSPAPAAQTGEAAFEKARAGSRLNAAQSLAEADAALGDAIGAAGGAADRTGWLRAGRRLFVLRQDVWSDIAAAADAPAIAIAPYGPAWLDLLARLPGLRPAAMLGDRVIIAGQGLVLRLQPEGRQTLTDGDWRRIEHAFGADRG